MLGLWLVRLFLCTLPFLSYADVPHLPEVKRQLIEYVEKGDYHNIIAKRIETVRRKLHFRVQKTPALERQKWAFVFDIDETLLSNFKSMQGLSFGGNEQLFEAMDRSGQGRSIEPVKALYHYAQAHGIAVFIITGRPEDERSETVANLQKEGIHEWRGLYFWPRHSDKTIVGHKDGVRCKLRAQGYDIVINVGDQESDLLGNCQAEYNIKLPNPFYDIPADRRRAQVKTAISTS